MLVQNWVYFLIDGEEIVYVGKTIEGIFRIIGHIKERVKVFDSYSFIKVKDETKLLEIEEIYIRKFHPKYNKSKNSKYKPKTNSDQEYRIKIPPERRKILLEEQRFRKYNKEYFNKS